MRIAAAELLPIRLPLCKPVENAQGVISVREGTLLRLASDEGLIGWGEASPYPGFGLESVEQARAALGRAVHELLGCEIDDRDDLIARVQASTQLSPTARAGVETAVLDISARGNRLPLHEVLVATPGQSADPVPCNALVTGATHDELERSASSLAAQGFRTFKLKIGAQGVDRDVARVALLREVLGTEVAIRLDANQAYRGDSAAAAIERFAGYGIEYLEQPVASRDIEAMAELRRKSPIPLAADEAAVSEQGTRRVIDAGAADVIVIKPSAAGGPLAAQRIARAARQAGLQIVVTSLMDSAVGLCAARHTAAALAKEGVLPACGLATSGVFERDVAEVAPLADGRFRLSHAAGLGIAIDVPGLDGCLSGPVVRLST